MSGTKQQPKENTKTAGAQLLSTTSSNNSCHRRPHHCHDDNTWIDRALDRLRDHRLHPSVEVSAAWLVALLCLLYYGYVYVASLLLAGQRRVPLMTEVRRRRRREGTDCQTKEEAEKMYQLIKEALGDIASSAHSNRDELIARIRSDSSLRRHVSQFVMLMTSVIQVTEGSTQEMQQLNNALDSIWLDLLRLPSIVDNEEKGQEVRFEISLVLPAYNEHGANVAHTLRWALNHCARPDIVQVIVVDGGHCTDLDDVHRLRQTIDMTTTTTTSQGGNCWGDLKIVKYTGSGGRGPIQNFGADHATGRLLTFLHSDTLVPKNWDAKVKAALQSTNVGVTTHACTFSVGHNVSKEALGSMPYPWGIRSILFLGNFRAYLFRLPYGDHILSFPALYFRYVGGFPDQPIMEDYDIMDLLRQRAKVLPESLRIIPPPTGLCSVRRWQSFGVTYVTVSNALLVNRYALGGWTADEVFNYYYRRHFQQKKDS